MNEYEEIENSILSIMINNSDSIINLIDELRPEDFINKTNRKVFECMLELYSENSIVDLVLLEKKLTDENIYEKFGGREKLIRLNENKPLTSLVTSYIDILKNESLRRRIVDSCDKIINKSTVENVTSSKDLLDYAQAMIEGISLTDTNSDVINLSEISKERQKQIEDLKQGLLSTIGIPTLYKEYDHITNGLHGSDLIILAARPSVGKTAFSLNLAVNVAKQGHSVLFFSYEMGKTQLYNRVLSMVSGVELYNIINFKLTDEELMKIDRAEEQMKNYKFAISENANNTVLDIKKIARSFKKQHKNLDFIVVDYLQLIPSPYKTMSREQQVSEISRSLKLLAKEINVPILALAQLSRNVENRSEKRPQLSDLRESGAIEQDADQVMFLQRESISSESENNDVDKTDSMNVELILGKHRNGAIGSVHLRFTPKYQLFDDKFIIKK